MMKQQTPDFILGYLFNSVERKIVKAKLSTDKFPYPVTESIPLLWFGTRRSDPPASVLILADELCKRLDATLSDVFTKYSLTTEVVRDQQYFTFITTIENRRNLTVSQIEKLLGFKINIIEEDAK